MDNGNGPFNLQDESTNINSNPPPSDEEGIMPIKKSKDKTKDKTKDVDKEAIIKTIKTKVLISITFLSLVWLYVYFTFLKEFGNLYWDSKYDKHCIFVLPIFVFMIFLRRNQFQYKTFTTSKLGILVLFLLSILWGHYNITENTLGEQFCIIGMLPAIVYTVIGKNGCKVILFPLMFLLFAIPFGAPFAEYFPDVFEVILEDFWRVIFHINLPIKFGMITSNSTSISLSEVLEFLLWTPAILMLGALFAFIVSKKAWKQFIIALSFFVFPYLFTSVFLGIVLSFKNWHTIVSPTSLSIFVTIVCYAGIVLAIILGLTLKRIISFIQPHPSSGDFISNFIELEWIIPVAIAGIVFLSTPTLVYMTKDVIYIYQKTLTDLKPPKIKGYHGPARVKSRDWSPYYPLSQSSFIVQYRRNQNNLQLFTAYFGRNIEAKMLTHPENRIFSTRNWKVESRKSFTTKIPYYSDFEVKEVVLTQNGYTKIIWYWYYIGNKIENRVSTTNILDMLRYVVKAYDNAGIVAIATNVTHETNVSRSILKSFLYDLSPHLDDIIDPRIIK